MSMEPEFEGRLKDLVTRALDEAGRQGASGAEASASTAQGLSVSVRLGEIETIEHHRDKGLGLTVYFGSRSGSASTTDFSDRALVETVRAACAIARHTAEDPYSGLADPARLQRVFPDLALNHPWGITVDEAIAVAKACEGAARGVDPRITNSEGASVSVHEGVEAYGNSHGFLAASRGTRHSVSCAVVAGDDAGMQRDYWYTSDRNPACLESAESVGREAGRRTVARLGARRLTTRDCPVLFEAPIAGSLLSHFVSAVRGGSLYRRASFLLDRLGKPVFAPGIRIHENPYLPGATGSTAWDSDGVATSARDLVKDGVLQGYVLDSYSARKLGMETTGNAGGVHNLMIDSGSHDFGGMMKSMGTGLLVTELIGFGVNGVTGDYSRGATGFWVEGGEIQFPVEEITIAGNLREIFRDIVSVGTDVDARGNIRSGSILIGKMTVAGE